MHMVRVGDGRSEAGIRCREVERIFGASDALARVRVVVQCGQIVWRESERGLVKCNRIDSSGLAVREWRRFIGEAALNPQPRIGRIEF